MIQRMFVRLLAITTCALVVLLSGMMTLETKSAHAATILTCLGHESATYSPGITNIAKPIAISFTSHLSECVGIPLHLTSGEGSATFTSKQACNEVPGTDDVSYRQTITWNNGQKSVVNWTDVSISAVDGTASLTKTGTVIAGLGAGSHATATMLMPDTRPLACATTGVTSEEGTLTFELH